MSISTVVTGGFGSFGSVNLVPTLGFSIGAIVVPDSEGLEYTLPAKKRGYILSKLDKGYTLKTKKSHYNLEEK